MASHKTRHKTCFVQKRCIFSLSLSHLTGIQMRSQAMTSDIISTLSGLGRRSLVFTLSMLSITSPFDSRQNRPSPTPRVALVDWSLFFHTNACLCTWLHLANFRVYSSRRRRGSTAVGRVRCWTVGHHPPKASPQPRGWKQLSTNTLLLMLSCS